MHPTIFSLGPFAVRGYGLMLAIGFFSGILFAAWRAKKAGENPDHVFNLSVWLVISSLLGSRIYYILTHFNEFRAYGDYSPIERMLIEFKRMFWPIGSDGQIGISGLIFLGGLILATIAAIVYLRYHHLRILKYLDILAPSIALGEAFTRIGCFLNGCCFGHPTHSPFGIIFPDTCAAGSYFPGVPIHPTQLYNSLVGLMIFGLLLWLERYKKFDGFTALMFFMLYSIGRFTIDFFRYYEESMQVFSLSQNQIISLILFIVSAALLIYFSKRAASKNKTLTN
ncbi:MAG: prolipoprotein diacylglyceryl transferase [Candidatus Latescibacterota bacterium]